MKFSKGDKVKALKTFANVVEGDVYTVKGEVWYLDYFTLEECKDGLMYNPINFELVVDNFKVGDFVLCVDNQESALLSVNETYEIEGVNIGMSKDYITLKDVSNGGVAFHKDRFIKVPTLESSVGNVVMKQISDLVTQPIDFFSNEHGNNKAYTSFIHDDGNGVSTHVSIDGSHTWIKLLQEYVSFLKGIGYRINDNDIKLSSERQSNDWFGEYHYED